MDFDQLRILLAVLEQGSFTRAAEALGLSQSTVSFQIKALESTVGDRLLDRGREGVRATAAGQLLRGYAQQLLSLRGEALQQLRAESQGQRGRLRVAASTIPGEYLLPPHLARLRDSHPGVDVHVEVSASSRAISAVLARECDMALVGRRPQHRGLQADPFAEDEVVLVGPTPNPWASAVEQMGREALPGVPLVLRGEGSGTRAAVAQLLTHAASEPEAAAARVIVESTEAVKRCVRAGLGLGFISRHAVADDLEAGRLEVVPLVGTPVARRFWVVMRRDRTPSSAAAALVATLVPGSA
ncbi:MAG: LysR family transcriptional regulator [Deltaproteobacteria bacterium]|nr:LysR family transcriptional regulator [Deltaproteobacteria bacterium]